MSTTPTDYLVERRVITRKLSFWRLAAFGVAILAVLVVGYRVGGGATSNFSPHIARVAIEGLIVGDKATLDLLEEVGKSRAAAVVLAIDSPGGTTAGSERLYGNPPPVSKKSPSWPSLETWRRRAPISPRWAPTKSSPTAIPWSAP